MAGPLIARKDIATGAVSFQKRRFGAITGKAKEARVFFSFQTAGDVVTVPHALGKKPSSYQVIASGRTNAGAAAAPGTFYTPDPVYWATASFVSLASETAASWAEVIIRE